MELCFSRWDQTAAILFWLSLLGESKHSAAIPWLCRTIQSYYPGKVCNWSLVEVILSYLLSASEPIASPNFVLSIVFPTIYSFFNRKKVKNIFFGRILTYSLIILWFYDYFRFLLSSRNILDFHTFVIMWSLIVCSFGFFNSYCLPQPEILHL